MSTNEYHFISRWRVEGAIEDVAEILEDGPGLARWWPSVYLAVRELEPPQADRTGRVLDLHTRGRLPYTLRWRLRVTESRHPHGFSLQAWGDFEGTGSWTFEENGRFVSITYDWRIQAEKPLLRYFSFLLKPVFAANHRWAMAQGEVSLKRELSRRRAARALAHTPAAGHLVADPGDI